MANTVRKAQPLVYTLAEPFLHCKRCLDEFYAGVFGNGQSPHEALSYELSGYLLEREGIKERIVVAWCKRCRRSVWNSSHLRPRDSA